LKGELKRAAVGYKELAEWFNRHCREETETSITVKLARGKFAVSFFLACLAVLELEDVLGPISGGACADKELFNYIQQNSFRATRLARRGNP
jgi:hypothetical protein